MKRILRYLISEAIIISVIAIHGCQTNDHRKVSGGSLTTGESFFIDLSKIKEVSFYDIFSSVEIIPLETNPESVIKNITKFLYHNGRFYILDRDQGAILIFDGHGNYCMKIQAIGNGPGEYTQIDDFIINRFTGNIELLNPRGEIMIYDSTSNFIESFRIPMKAIHYFEYLTNDIIVLYSIYEPSKLYYLSKPEEKIIKQEYSVPDFIIRQTPLKSNNSPFVFYNNCLRFFQGFSDTVYNISLNKIEPYVIWDFGQNRLNLNNLPADREIDFYFNFLRGSNFAYGYYTYSENDEIIFTRFVYNKRWIFLILKKKDFSYLLIPEFREHIYLPLSPVLIGESLMATVDPSEIQLLVNQAVLDSINSVKFRNMNLYDNPAILIYKFKSYEK